MYASLRGRQNGPVPAPESPPHSTLLRSGGGAGVGDGALDPAWGQLVGAVEQWAGRCGGTVLTLRPVPGDVETPMGALARSAAALVDLHGVLGAAPAVRACRELGVRAIVVERIELLDDASAAVIHHLVDGGVAAVVATVTGLAPLPEPILGLVVSDRMRVINAAERDRHPDGDPASGADGASRDEAGGPPLTDREHEIAEYVVEGWRNREIADRLCVSVRTVEGHVLRLCRKLGVTDRSQVETRHLDPPGGADPAAW